MEGTNIVGVKLVGLDLDGTLLNPDGNIVPVTRRHLGALFRRGMLLAIVTGRPMEEVLRLLETNRKTIAAVSNRGPLFLGGDRGDKAGARFVGVVSVKKPRLALLLLLGLLLGLAVSGGGRSSESPTVAAASMQSACGDVVFPSLRGIPGTAIALAGLPTGWRDEDTFARLEVEGYDGLTPVYIELLGDGEAELVLPFHPLDAMGGGSGAVVIYNEAEEVACPPVAVTIEPLTPAPEGMGMGDMFDALQHSFTARAERFGFSKADLLAMDLRQSPGIGVDPVDPARNLIIGLAAGLQMLEGDGVADNGRSILSGTVSAALCLQPG